MAAIMIALCLLEVTKDPPVLTQFLKKGQFVIQTAWIV